MTPQGGQILQMRPCSSKARIPHYTSAGNGWTKEPYKLMELAVMHAFGVQQRMSNMLMTPFDAVQANDKSLMIYLFKTKQAS